MIQKVQACLYNEIGFKIGQKILVALSGGPDSMALLHVLKKLDVDITAAHCNFNLRGGESDGDEKFVIDETRKSGIQLFLKSFDTIGFSKENGISIEMAARELRYNWFNELLQQNKLDWIATGHHVDDNIETVFLNMARGTGIKGISGIKSVAGNVIRPLINITRAEIEEYCHKNNYHFRIDSTNHESVYTRNKLRNQILPMFEDINTSFRQTMVDNIKKFEQVQHLMEHYVEEVKERIVIEQEGQVLISLKQLVELKDLELVLFEILYPYGFNGAIVHELVECIQNNISGKQFYSNDYRLIKDRVNLILFPKHDEVVNLEYYVSVDEKVLKEPLNLTIETLEDATNYQIVKDNSVGQFDADFIEFPLKIRKWKQGDIFRPLGMKNFKKLSDFFIDQKFSIKDKEDCWLLLTGDNIMWIIGHRMDDRYKVTGKTKRVVKIF